METVARHRISKREFISRVAASSGLSIKTVSEVYEALFSELREAVSQGEIVVLTGFGRFYRQEHKGHRVRFGKRDVADYSVLKFSASRSVNRRLEDGEIDDGDLARVELGPELYGMITDLDGIEEHELEAAS